MGQEKMDLSSFIKEFSQLLTRGVNKAIQGEEFNANMAEINQRMIERCGRTLDTLAIVIGAEFITKETEMGASSRLPVSFDLKLTGSKEDEEVTRGMHVHFNEKDAEEVNRTLEQARKARVERENAAASVNAEKISRPLAEEGPTETETAELADPRSISQIINSIREVARALNFKQRQFFVQAMPESFKCFGIELPGTELLKKDVVWLQLIQDFVCAIRGRGDTLLSMSVLLSLRLVLLDLKL
jgi:hypothetical protein